MKETNSRGLFNPPQPLPDPPRPLPDPPRPLPDPPRPLHDPSPTLPDPSPTPHRLYPSPTPPRPFPNPSPTLPDPSPPLPSPTLPGPSPTRTNAFFNPSGPSSASFLPPPLDGHLTSPRSVNSTPLGSPERPTPDSSDSFHHCLTQLPADRCVARTSEGVASRCTDLWLTVPLFVWTLDSGEWSPHRSPTPLTTWDPTSPVPCSSVTVIDHYITSAERLPIPGACPTCFSLLGSCCCCCIYNCEPVTLPRHWFRTRCCG
ncbi:hypothetical protein Pcinc_043707 [Petrolisthes cinctipes]|uniref:Uncharacterized protein n=1 Tax=Petrolisthes cinctipes TaxID=88211 RepID=A0AAE1BF00_PETCI|nr:hypothetical protein Pcinc_043707 [Petrolisthes cinctipes]